MRLAVMIGREVPPFVKGIGDILVVVTGSRQDRRPGAGRTDLVVPFLNFRRCQSGLFKPTCKSRGGSAARSHFVHRLSAPGSDGFRARPGREFAGCVGCGMAERRRFRSSESFRPGGGPRRLRQLVRPLRRARAGPGSGPRPLQRTRCAVRLPDFRDGR